MPALEQFRETLEGHFVTEPSITRGELIGYLQETLEDHGQESTNTSWEIASTGARSRSSGHACVSLISEHVTDTHPALASLPVVDISTSEGVFAVLQ